MELSDFEMNFGQPLKGSHHDRAETCFYQARALAELIASAEEDSGRLGDESSYRNLRPDMKATALEAVSHLIALGSYHATEDRRVLLNSNRPALKVAD